MSRGGSAIFGDQIKSVEYIIIDWVFFFLLFCFEGEKRFIPLKSAIFLYVLLCKLYFEHVNKILFGFSLHRYPYIIWM